MVGIAVMIMAFYNIGDKTQWAQMESATCFYHMCAKLLGMLYRTIITNNTNIRNLCFFICIGQLV